MGRTTRRRSAPCSSSGCSLTGWRSTPAVRRHSSTPGTSVLASGTERPTPRSWGRNRGCCPSPGVVSLAATTRGRERGKVSACWSCVYYLSSSFYEASWIALISGVTLWSQVKLVQLIIKSLTVDLLLYTSILKEEEHLSARIRSFIFSWTLHGWLQALKLSGNVDTFLLTRLLSLPLRWQRRWDQWRHRWRWGGGRKEGGAGGWSLGSRGHSVGWEEEDFPPY